MADNQVYNWACTNPETVEPEDGELYHICKFKLTDSKKNPISTFAFNDRCTNELFILYGELIPRPGLEANPIRKKVKVIVSEPYSIDYGLHDPAGAGMWLKDEQERWYKLEKPYRQSYKEFAIEMHSKTMNFLKVYRAVRDASVRKGTRKCICSYSIQKIWKLSKGAFDLGFVYREKDFVMDNLDGDVDPERSQMLYGSIDKLELSGEAREMLTPPAHASTGAEALSMLSKSIRPKPSEGGRFAQARAARGAARGHIADGGYDSDRSDNSYRPAADEEEEEVREDSSSEEKRAKNDDEDGSSEASGSEDDETGEEESEHEASKKAKVNGSNLGSNLAGGSVDSLDRGKQEEEEAEGKEIPTWKLVERATRRALKNRYWNGVEIPFVEPLKIFSPEKFNPHYEDTEATQYFKGSLIRTCAGIAKPMLPPLAAAAQELAASAEADRKILRDKQALLSAEDRHRMAQNKKMKKRVGEFLEHTPAEMAAAAAAKPKYHKLSGKAVFTHLIKASGMSIVDLTARPLSSTGNATNPSLPSSSSSSPRSAAAIPKKIKSTARDNMAVAGSTVPKASSDRSVGQVCGGKTDLKRRYDAIARPPAASSAFIAALNGGTRHTGAAVAGGGGRADSDTIAALNSAGGGRSSSQANGRSKLQSKVLPIRKKQRVERSSAGNDSSTVSQSLPVFVQLQEVGEQHHLPALFRPVDVKPLGSYSKKTFAHKISTASTATTKITTTAPKVTASVVTIASKRTGGDGGGIGAVVGHSGLSAQQGNVAAGGAVGGVATGKAPGERGVVSEPRGEMERFIREAGRGGDVTGRGPVAGGAGATGAGTKKPSWQFRPQLDDLERDRKHYKSSSRCDAGKVVNEQVDERNRERVEGEVENRSERNREKGRRESERSTSLASTSGINSSSGSGAGRDEWGASRKPAQTQSLDGDRHSYQRRGDFEGRGADRGRDRGSDRTASNGVAYNGGGGVGRVGGGVYKDFGDHNGSSPRYGSNEWSSTYLHNTDSHTYTNHNGSSSGSSSYQGGAENRGDWGYVDPSHNHPHRSYYDYNVPGGFSGMNSYNNSSTMSTSSSAYTTTGHYNTYAQNDFNGDRHDRGQGRGARPRAGREGRDGDDAGGRSSRWGAGDGAMGAHPRWGPVDVAQPHYQQQQFQQPYPQTDMQNYPQTYADQYAEQASWYGDKWLDGSNRPPLPPPAHLPPAPMAQIPQPSPRNQELYPAAYPQPQAQPQPQVQPQTQTQMQQSSRANPSSLHKPATAVGAASSLVAVWNRNQTAKKSALKVDTLQRSPRATSMNNNDSNIIINNGTSSGASGGNTRPLSVNDTLTGETGARPQDGYNWNTLNEGKQKEKKVVRWPDTIPGCNIVIREYADETPEMRMYNNVLPDERNYSEDPNAFSSDVLEREDQRAPSNRDQRSVEEDIRNAGLSIPVSERRKGPISRPPIG